MVKSLKANYFFNLVNTGSQFLFPLITLPYASRIMGPEGIGLVNFYQSIISYIILIVGLGIPMYGIKAIARVRDNKAQLSQTTFEILLLHSGLTIIAYIIVALLSVYVPQINSNVFLFLLLSLSILFTTIGCDWFYKGIEDFKYITVRGIIVKSLAVIFLFTLVKDKQDIIWYGLYCVVGTLGGNIFNFVRLQKFIEVKNLEINYKKVVRHLKPVFQIFIFSVVTSLYLNMNPIILGFLKGDAAVGYYSSGLKLFSIAVSISGSLGVVMLPRVSYLLAEGKKEEFCNLTQKAYNYSLGISLPLCVLMIFLSPYAIRILCGHAFEPSIICAQIMSPIVVFLAVSSLMGTQILYPMGEIKIINKYCATGAVIDIFFSIIFVPLLAQLGTSIAYSTTELAVMFLSIIASKKFISINYLNKSVSHYIVGVIIMIVLLAILTNLQFNDFVMFAIIGTTGLLVYAVYLIIVKDQIIESAFGFIHK